MPPLPKVVYVSPNRSHHYRYAEGLEKVGLLHRFVSGFPRFSSQARALAVPEEKIIRVDAWQSLYVGAVRSKVPASVREWLNARSKRSLDRAFGRAMRDADIGLFYNGTGLATLKRWKGSGKLFVCEAVNAHVRVQQALMEAEARRLNVKWTMPDANAIPRREDEYALSDYILCPSDFVVGSFTRMGFSAERCLKNPFGMPLPEITVGLRSRDDSKAALHVLYVGQIHFRKGIHYLIEALQALKNPRVRLDLVGPRSEPTGLDSMQLPDWVHFHGILKGVDLDQAYRNADIFVQPSMEEGLSLVIGEAMGHGLPVIASDHTGAEEILSHGDSGLIFKAGDKEQLAVCLQTLIDDPAKRAELGKRARERAESFNGWEASGANLAMLLQSVWDKHLTSSGRGASNVP